MNHQRDDSPDSRAPGTCLRCGGSGTDPGTGEQCERCSGSGRRPVEGDA
jgi:DnaJ-class molecular chaperone